MATLVLGAAGAGRLRGRAKGAKAAPAVAAFVAENGMQVVEFATPEETVAAVKNGEAVAVLADSDYLKPIADESGGALVLLDKTESIGGGVGMAFRKSDKELHDKFDAAITSMKCDGTLDAMIQKAEYFGPDSPLAWGDKGKEGC